MEFFKTDMQKNLIEYLEKNNFDDSASSKPYVAYGTAGFRGNASDIEHIFLKVGLFAGLMSIRTEQNIGIMITASHNPVDDNGVKIIQSDGSMLDTVWESIVETLCNTYSIQIFVDQIMKIFEPSKHILVEPETGRSTVMIGWDTRPSSERMKDLTVKGIEFWKLKIDVNICGQITTPALHYIVAESSKTIFLTTETYFDQLSNGLSEIFGSGKRNEVYKSTDLTVDCANGVGFKTIEELVSKDRTLWKHLPLKSINIGDGELNHLCGADYVKTTKKACLNADKIKHRYASLDGDADRIVYFYLSQNNKFHLLDGDKIAVLFARYIKKQLENTSFGRDLSMAMIQTAYSNGASTEYLTKELNLKVDCVTTGVKNLHRQAVRYDVAIYFEANGHGTILLSDGTKTRFEQEKSQPHLRQLLKILNNATGDAVSNMLIVETILRHYDWSIETWDKLYTDRPNHMTKVRVNDKNSIKTKDADRICIEPKGLQNFIDECVEKYGFGARCFVRPSGTENYVRIYAEAQTQQSAEELATKVAERIQDRI